MTGRGARCPAGRRALGVRLARPRRHGSEDLPHAPEGVRRGQEAFRHGQEAFRHGREAFRRTPGASATDFSTGSRGKRGVQTGAIGSRTVAEAVFPAAMALRSVAEASGAWRKLSEPRFEGIFVSWAFLEEPPSPAPASRRRSVQTTERPGADRVRSLAHTGFALRLFRAAMPIRIR